MEESVKWKEMWNNAQINPTKNLYDFPFRYAFLNDYGYSISLSESKSLLWMLIKVMCTWDDEQLLIRQAYQVKNDEAMAFLRFRRIEFNKQKVVCSYNMFASLKWKWN